VRLGGFGQGKGCGAHQRVIPFREAESEPPPEGHYSHYYKAFRPSGIVAVDFPRFGEGEYHRSDFEVRVRWKDVERMIKEFCEMEHPKALAVTIKLAAAAKELGWQILF
jgi:hypothetical protein